MNRPETLADDLCARVGRRGIAAWLHELTATLGVSSDLLMPTRPVARHCVTLDSIGLRVVLRHPHAGHVEIGDPDRWVLTDVIIDIALSNVGEWRLPLPFGLTREVRDIADVEANLGSDCTALSVRDLSNGNRRQTYYLDRAQAVELTWSENGRSIKRLWIVRLGDELLEAMSE